MRRCLLLLACVSVLLAACGGNKNDDTLADTPVDELYNTATDAIQAGNYKKAIKYYDEVDRQHPYSVWASKAEIMSAYAQYQTSQYDEAISGFDRFIALHPGNRDAAYAYYMKALCYYEQITTVDRDQDMTRKALGALEEVIKRFPGSTYGRDARIKIDLTRDHLAGKEMTIGRYYQAKGDLVAAINRFHNVVEQYQTTTHAPEALERLTECYYALGLGDEARRTAAVLGYNYPGSDWYAASYALVQGDSTSLEAPREQGSWLSRTWDSVF